jgi:DNA ligase (NAD+)
MTQIKVGSRVFASVDQLEKLVIHAATEYEVTGYVEDFDGVEVTDPEYDELIRQLRNLKPNSEAFSGTSPSKAKVKGSMIVHNPPMTSIDKADGTPDEKETIYKKWLESCAQKLGVKVADLEVVQSYKHDGVALRVNYVNGKLVSAGLRPRDGVNGSDVTRHMKNIAGVPQKLPLPLTLSLNGEIECHINDFEAINAERDAAGEEQYKNPRNFTAGCMGRDDPDENKGSKLRVTFYSITGFDEWADYYKSEIERAKWANSADGLNLVDSKGKGYFVQVRKHRFADLEKMEAGAAELPYYTDGVVLKVNSLEYQEELGHSGDDPTNPPRCALAWKFKEEEAEAVIDHLEWNASRTGRVVPKAIFKKSVMLADTDVSRATVNNYGWAHKMGIGSGTVVKVKKAGKIIPNVCGVVSGAVADIGAPKQCPTCDANLDLVTSSSGNTDLMCLNVHCIAKQINACVFYLAKLGAKGIGASVMEKILASGKVKSLAGLYSLEVDDLIAAGLSERQTLLALATIYMIPPDQDSSKLFDQIENARNRKHKTEAWKFFAALGIPGAGETAGKALVLHYKDFDKIRNASREELEEVSGIGTTTAKSICQWFFEHDSVVDELLEHVELELPKTGKLTGKNFVLTGSFTEGKSYWKKLIEDQGGNVQSSVGSTTSYLIQEHGKNDGSPSDKEQKAAKLNVPVISVVELKKML